MEIIFTTERLIVRQFEISMAKDVHLNSLDEDTRKFVPDEVFETIEDAEEILSFLINQYQSKEGPFVYPIFLKDNTNIGYVQLVKIEEGFEIGYHIAKKYTCKGYATEVVKEFINYCIKEFDLNQIYGICLKSNLASNKVLIKSGFKLFFEGDGLYKGEISNICKYIFTKNK